MGPAPEGTRTLRLIGLPLQLYARMVDQHESMVRECSLVALAAESGQVVASPHLRQVSVDVRRRYRALRSAFEAQVEQARDTATTPAIDVEVAAPPDLVETVTASIALLDALDDLCRRGELLVVPSPPAVVALRHWLGDEVRAQLGRGEEPTPVPGGLWGAPG
jgi:hypothetical protein